MPELFQAMAARTAGLQPDQVTIHSPMLGGFFGRHFMYGPSNPFPQAILLAKETRRPVKVLWSREEEFLNDALRPLSHSRFRAALDSQENPTAWPRPSVQKRRRSRRFRSRAARRASTISGSQSTPAASSIQRS